MLARDQIVSEGSALVGEVLKILPAGRMKGVESTARSLLRFTAKRLRVQPQPLAKPPLVFAKACQPHRLTREETAKMYSIPTESGQATTAGSPSDSQGYTEYCQGGCDAKISATSLVNG